jgi:hypothetical protein
MRHKSCLGAEPGEQADQAIGALVRLRRTCLQDPEDGMILVISFCKFCVSNLFITFDFMLQKASTRVDPYYLDIWQAAHQGNAATAERLLSINFYSYASFVIFCRTDIWRSRRRSVGKI